MKAVITTNGKNDFVSIKGYILFKITNNIELKKIVITTKIELFLKFKSTSYP